MDKFDEIFAELEAVRNETNSFVYRHPITGETKEGIGKAPLNWGEYPTGIEAGTTEANDYDAFRSNYLPLPHVMMEGDLGEESKLSLTSPEVISMSQNMPEGSQLNDVNWISASTMLYNYLHPNAKPFGSTETREIYKGVKQSGYPVENAQLENAEAYATWGINFMTAFDYNFTALAFNAGKLSNAPPEVAKAMYYLMETADRSGMTLKNFGKGALAMATDPFNLGVLATFGIGVAGKYAGQQMTRMAFKELLKKIILSAPTKSSMAVGAEAGFLTMADNLARQNVKIDANVQDKIDPVEAGTSAVIGSVLGDRLTAGMPSLLEGGRRLLVRGGKEADNYLANNPDTGTTLNMGADPTIPIAEGLSTIGKALDNTTPKVDQDELGFYSKALEVTKGLKQEKGSGQQFKSMLIKNGVKQDELDWLGLDEVLSKDKVTKAEIEQHINDNRIRISEDVAEVDETAKEMDFSASEENVRLDDLALEKGVIPNQLKATYTAEEAYGDAYLADRASEILEDHNANLSEFDPPMTESRAMELAVDEYYDNPIRFYEDKNTGYVISGNDDLGYSIYRNKEESFNWENRLDTDGDDLYSLNEAEIQAQAIAHETGDIDLYGRGARWRDYTVDEGQTGENYREIKLILDNSKEGDFYEPAHFDEENILAHIRTTDRVSDDGSKVLFIEEIQSDWGQQGRRDGFKLTNKEYKDLEIEIKKLKADHIKEINSFTIKQGDKQIPFADFYFARIKEMAVSEYDKIMAKKINNDGLQQHFINELSSGFIYKNGKQIDGQNINILEKAQKSYETLNSTEAKKYNKVPQAPFVNDTNKWTALTIKRLMAKASEEGYDYIAFSAGKFHVDRWNKPALATYYDKVLPSVISKVVGKIDKDSITNVTMRHSTYYEDTGYKIYSDLDGFPQLAIKITPEIKDTVSKGQALFSAGGLIGAGTLNTQGENSEVMNGNT